MSQRDLSEEPTLEARARMTRADWLQLLDMRQQINEADEFKVLNGKYFVWTSLVKDFHDLVYELPIVVSFPWTSWEQGKAALGDPSASFDHFDLDDLCKLITTVVRAERFNEGYLPAKFEDGTISKILDAIDRLTN